MDYGIKNPPKIDREATDGLLGVNNSLAYRVHEIERHLHSYERWFEAAASPSGEVHVADQLGDNGGTEFQVDAGNDDWGNYLQILGSSDTPSIAGSAKFNAHRVFITSTERTAVYFIQVLFGASGAAALAAGTYTEFPFQPLGPQADSAPIAINTRRINTGTKTWVRIKCPGQSTATLDFFFGIHEYEG